MQTRTLRTCFWEDDFVINAMPNTRYLFIYLITNSRINISGLYHLPEKIIMFDTSLDQADYNNAREELEKANKALFQRGWVYVPNAFKNFQIWKSPRNWLAWYNEFQRVPNDVLASLDTSIYTSMHTALLSTTSNQLPTNSKKETIYHKQLSEVIKAIIAYQRKAKKQEEIDKSNETLIEIEPNIVLPENILDNKITTKESNEMVDWAINELEEKL